jgi:hypothetical protein
MTHIFYKIYFAITKAHVYRVANNMADVISWPVNISIRNYNMYVSIDFGVEGKTRTSEKRQVEIQLLERASIFFVLLIYSWVHYDGTTVHLVVTVDEVRAKKHHLAFQALLRRTFTLLKRLLLSHYRDNHRSLFAHLYMYIYICVYTVYYIVYRILYTIQGAYK